MPNGPGRLSWNGKPTENLLRPLRQACGVVPQSWMINSKDWWLLGMLGLHYTVQLAVVPPEPGAEPVPGPIFIAIGDKVHTVHQPEDLAAAGWDNCLSLDTFVSRYRHQIQLFVDEQRASIDMPLPARWQWGCYPSLLVSAGAPLVVSVAGCG